MRNCLKYQGSKEYAALIFNTMSLYKTTFRSSTSSYVSMNKGAINMRIIFALPISLLLASCATIPTSTSKSALPSSFTTENIMKVHQGMRSNEILQLFGEPKNISSAVCGRVPNQWTCTTWEYGNSPYGRARFTFSGKHGSYVLNDFDVDRD